MEQVHYPVTASADEWSDELLRLDQLLVEGFEEKWLKSKAASLKRTTAPQLRALKLIEECLIGFGFESDHARQLMSPLHEVHNLRSLMKGHTQGTEAASKKRAVLTEYKSYKNHFKSLCQRCDETIRTIGEAFKE